MKSGWWWNTKMWAEYQTAYHITRPEPEFYRSSPLADDHDFSQAGAWDEFHDFTTYHTQVLDITVPIEELWRGIRKSYRPLINKALRDYTFTTAKMADYHVLHAQANGQETRNQRTWECMEAWMANGYGGLVAASQHGVMLSGAYFILYQGAAYYASGASLQDNVQHAVLWTAIKRLKAAGIGLLEMGQIDGKTVREKSIGLFKQGFGGKAVPFMVARRRTI